VKAGRGGRVSGTSRSPGITEFLCIQFLSRIIPVLIRAEHQISTQVGLSSQALCMHCGVPVRWMGVLCSTDGRTTREKFKMSDLPRLS
jgi:hypothetical protein